MSISSTMATPTFRPARIRRMNRHELLRLDHGKCLNSRFSSSGSRSNHVRPLNSRESSSFTSRDVSSVSTAQTQMSNSYQNFSTASRYLDDLGETTEKTTNKNEKPNRSRRCWCRRCFWFTLCFCTLLLLFLGAVAALIALLLLRTTTTMTTSTTTTATTSTTSTRTTSTTSTTSVTTVTTSTTSTTSTTITTSTSTSTTSKTTTTTTSVTTTTQTTTLTTRPLPNPICTDFGLGSIYQQFTASPSTWTPITRTYVANYTDPVLVLGFQTSGGDFHYVDNISVVDTTNPSVELLDNSGFSNTSSPLVGWNQWCISSCNNNGNTAAGEQYSSYPCSAANKCLQTCCDSTTSGIYFIGQKFEAVLGRSYSISFSHIHLGSGGSFEMYVDIF